MDMLDHIAPKKPPQPIALQKPLYEPQFAVTFTLLPKLYNHVCGHQYELSRDILYNALASVGFYCTLICEVTKQCNVHYHGIIASKGPALCEDKAKMLIKNCFRDSKVIGYQYRCNHLTDYGGWMEYITKDLRRTKEISMIDPIFKDEFKVFSKADLEEYGLKTYD